MSGKDRRSQSTPWWSGTEQSQNAEEDDGWSFMDALTDFGSNSARNDQSSATPDQMLTSTLSGLGTGADSGGGFGDWWQENVVENLEAADRYLMGNGDNSMPNRGGMVLYWDGNGDQGPASEGKTNESLNITDLMDAFGVLGKSAKLEPSDFRAFLQDPSNMKKFYAGAKDLKAFAKLVLEDIPEAWDALTEDELDLLPLDPAMKKAFKDARTELSKKKGGPVAHDDKERPDADVASNKDGGAGGAGSTGGGGGYGVGRSRKDAADRVEDTQTAGGVTAKPGEVLVTLGPGNIVPVPAWKLPVKRWSGHGGLNFYLREKYADGSYRNFIDTKGRNLGYQMCKSTEVKQGDWKSELSRAKHPDETWAHETAWGSFLRNSK